MFSPHKYMLTALKKLLVLHVFENVFQEDFLPETEVRLCVLEFPTFPTQPS